MSGMDLLESSGELYCESDLRTSYWVLPGLISSHRKRRKIDLVEEFSSACNEYVVTMSVLINGEVDSLDSGTGS